MRKLNYGQLPASINKYLNKRGKAEQKKLKGMDDIEALQYDMDQRLGGFSVHNEVITVSNARKASTELSDEDLKLLETKVYWSQQAHNMNTFNLAGSYETDDAYSIIHRECQKRGTSEVYPWYSCFPGSMVWFIVPIVVIKLLQYIF